MLNRKFTFRLTHAGWALLPASILLTLGAINSGLNVKVAAAAKKAGARLHAAFPHDTAHSRVHQLRYPDPKAGQKLRISPAESREVNVIAQKPGSGRLTTEFEIHLSPHGAWRTESSVRPMLAETA